MPPTPDPGSSQRTAGWVITGLGAAVLVGGGVAFALGQGDFAAFSEGKTDGESVQTLISLHENGSLKSFAGVVGLGVGGAMVIGGIAVLATAPKRIAPPPIRKSPSGTKQQLFSIPRINQ